MGGSACRFSGQVLFLKPAFPVCSVPDACRKGGAEINRTTGLSWDSLCVVYTAMVYSVVDTWLEFVEGP